MPSRNGTSTVADHRLGRLSGGVRRHDRQAREPHIYVANWFYLAFIITVAMLHVVNNLDMPVSLLGSKSYPLSPGCRMRWCSGGTATTRWASS
jgi:cbb3-type cytochrome oxidase subunit 1